MAEKTAAELQKELDSANAQIKSLTSSGKTKDDKITSLTSELEKVTSEKNNLSTSLDLANTQITGLENDKSILEATNSEYETLLGEAATQQTKIIAVTDPVVEHDGEKYRALKKSFWLPGESLPVRYDKLTDTQKVILIETGKLELLK